jgi:hypothetical protein
LVHLHFLFNGLIQHSYVPSDFLNGTVAPVIKNQEGDQSNPSNYCPITLSSLFSQMFVHVILLKIGHQLETDELQFGFKWSHSTSHALFILKSCIEYYVDHGSSVFVTFLD